MNILKTKQNKYKDFTCLQVACQMKGIEGKVLSSIKNASIVAGLKKISAKEQRRIMYECPEWLQVVKLVEIL